MTALIIALICLLFEGFFSSAEIAIVSADRAHIRELAQLGNRGAIWVEKFLQQPHRLLSNILLGTQLSVVVSTVVMTLWLHQVAHNRAEFFLLVCLTPAIIIFGEIVPKALVKKHANEWAPKAALILSVCMKIFFPVGSLLARISASVSEKLGIEAHRKLIYREELEQLVTTPTKQPTSSEKNPSDITEGERSMIARIFELGEVTVDHLMVPLSSVVALPEEATFAELVKEVVENKYSRIPIYRERLDQIVGIVNAFDVLIDNTQKTAKELMRPPLFAPESQSAVNLLSHMQEQKQGLAVVVDEYGGAVGIVTQEDILEEVVGEIEDEYDIPDDLIHKEPDGSYRVSASIPLSQLNQELSLHLPESDEYETVAGLILEQTKRIPRAGETVSIHSVIFSIEKASDRRVEEVRLKIIPAPTLE